MEKGKVFVISSFRAKQVIGKKKLVLK